MVFDTPYRLGFFSFQAQPRLPHSVYRDSSQSHSHGFRQGQNWRRDFCFNTLTLSQEMSKMANIAYFVFAPCSYKNDLVMEAPILAPTQNSFI
jgi:hypothetical protein